MKAKSLEDLKRYFQTKANNFYVEAYACEKKAAEHKAVASAYRDAADSVECLIPLKETP